MTNSPVGWRIRDDGSAKWWTPTDGGSSRERFATREAAMEWLLHSLVAKLDQEFRTFPRPWQTKQECGCVASSEGAWVRPCEWHGR